MATVLVMIREQAISSVHPSTRIGVETQEQNEDPDLDLQYYTNRVRFLLQRSADVCHIWQQGDGIHLIGENIKSDALASQSCT